MHFVGFCYKKNKLRELRRQSVCLYFCNRFVDFYYANELCIILQGEIYYLLAGVPGVARDEKLQKQIFEITWRDKGWIG